MIMSHQFTIAHVSSNFLKQDKEHPSKALPFRVGIDDIGSDVYNELKKWVDDRAEFDGFANGFLYRAFNALDHFAGVSGDAVPIITNGIDAMAGLEIAINMWNEINYPDPHRMDELKAFFERHKNEKTDNFLMIFF